MDGRRTAGGRRRPRPLPGDTYQFAIDGGEPLTDPRALRLPEGPTDPPMVDDPTGFDWTDDAWRGVALPGCGDLRAARRARSPNEGTLDGAIERLDHLVDLGVDLVELMPVASFPGRSRLGVRRRRAVRASTSPTAGPTR